ncbi:hypothetical protein [Brevibacillus antibioticus]|nr:hypothetical protein [Brevibacillus antibioticus]
MSRSYKKLPVVQDKTGPDKKFAKRLAFIRDAIRDWETSDVLR